MGRSTRRIKKWKTQRSWLLNGEDESVNTENIAGVEDNFQFKMLPLSPSMPLLPLNIPPSPTEIQGFVHDTTLTGQNGNWGSKVLDDKFNQIMETSRENANESESGGDLPVEGMTNEQMKLEIQILRRRNLRLRNELTAWQMRAEFAEKASSVMAEKLESLGSPYSPCGTDEEAYSPCVADEVAIVLDTQLKI